MKFGDSSEFQITRQDMGAWVRVCLGSGELPPDLHLYLSHALTEWMRSHPQYRIRCIVPIQNNGDTVELHAWYDQVQFPDVSGLTKG